MAPGARLPSRLRGLAPVVDAGVVVLVLGSFPSAASLAAGRYYAHPRNQFWPIMGALIGEPLPELPYPERLARALARGVGIWDVYRSCVRPGSLDAAIVAAADNDLARLRRVAPGLRAVAFNGRAAGRSEPDVRACGVATAVLPSTSPAHAGVPFAAKLDLWRAFFGLHLPPPAVDRRSSRTA
jgi:hypoxanthine-DNA glycosylase